MFCIGKLIAHSEAREYNKCSDYNELEHCDIIWLCEARVDVELSRWLHSSSVPASWQPMVIGKIHLHPRHLKVHTFTTSSYLHHPAIICMVTAFPISEMPPSAKIARQVWVRMCILYVYSTEFMCMITRYTHTYKLKVLILYLVNFKGQ